MNQNLSGTQTHKNLKDAFSGESQARHKYANYSKLARDAGDDDIADLFERMATNEQAHALVWLKLLTQVKTVEDALLDASAGENYESTKMYPSFAATAKEEGFMDIAQLFEDVGHIEFNHELTFMKALFELKSKSVPVQAPQQIIKDEEKSKPYHCTFCGYESETALVVCPVCKAIGAFQLSGE